MPLLGLIAYLALCYIVGLLGQDRKFGLWGTAAISFVFTPVIGLLVVLASDKKLIVTSATN
jgi:hypothetical protein